jgi:hypothetical protein
LIRFRHIPPLSLHRVHQTGREAVAYVQSQRDQDEVFGHDFEKSLKKQAIHKIPDTTTETNNNTSDFIR